MSADFQTTHLPRDSCSDPDIYAEQVCRIYITKDRRERDDLLHILTDRRVFLGYKESVKAEFEQYKALKIVGEKNVRLTDKDKRLVTEILTMAPHIREIALKNIAVNGLGWIPFKERIANIEFHSVDRNAIIDFQGIEEFPNLQRLVFYGFFEKSRNFKCIAKLAKPLSVFSHHSWFGKNIEQFGHFRLKQLVVTELFMQEMRQLSKLDYPELLEVLELYSTNELRLNLSELINLTCFAFGQCDRNIPKTIQVESLMHLKKLQGLYLSPEVVDDVAKLERFPFWKEIE